MFILKAKDMNILEKIHLLIFAPISFAVIIGNHLGNNYKK